MSLGVPQNWALTTKGLGLWPCIQLIRNPGMRIGWKGGHLGFIAYTLFRGCEFNMDAFPLLALGR